MFCFARTRARVIHNKKVALFVYAYQIRKTVRHSIQFLVLSQINIAMLKTRQNLWHCVQNVWVLLIMLWHCVKNGAHNYWNKFLQKNASLLSHLHKWMQAQRSTNSHIYIYITLYGTNYLWYRNQPWGMEQNRDMKQIPFQYK